MANPLKIIALGLTLALAACGGGVKVKGGSAKTGAATGASTDPAATGDTKPFSLQLTANTVDEAAGLFFSAFGLTSTTFASIYMRAMDIEIQCGLGAAKKQISYTLTSTDDNSGANTTGFTATFAGNVAANCDAATVIVDNVQGNFSTSTGLAFKLVANGLVNKYVFSGTSVTAGLVAPIPLTVGSVVATFSFNKASDSAAGGDVTARSTASGTTTVTVTDGCAGTATITTVDASSFKVWVPHALTNPIQTTTKVHDLTGATATYTEDGTTFSDPNPPNSANGAQWTFDFSSAAFTDAAVSYTMTVSGDGKQSCTANLTANVTASGGTPVVFPPATAVPPNPTNLTGNVISATQVDLSWTSGGGTTASFVVAYTTAGGAAPASCAVGAGVTTAAAASSPKSITGLTTGTTYAFRVCGKDAGAHLSGGITVTETTP